MRRRHHHAAPPPMPRQQRAKPRHRRDVEPQRRLVQQPKRGSAGQRKPRQCQPSPLPRRQQPRRQFRKGGQISPTASSASRTAARCTTQTAPGFRQRSSPGLQPVKMAKVGDARAVRRPGPASASTPFQVRPSQRRPSPSPARRRSSVLLPDPIRTGRAACAPPSRHAQSRDVDEAPNARHGRPPDPCPLQQAARPLPSLWTTNFGLSFPALHIASRRDRHSMNRPEQRSGPPAGDLAHEDRRT